MGLCLIAVAWTDPWLWLYVLMVAVGLGFVIFVHELGHFAVAKACGVKCEKFYLGFDIAGLKLCKFTWGETEYGIGVLPLGGYVKMLGQEDNPARLRQEIDRARQTQADAGRQTFDAPEAVAGADPPEGENARQNRPGQPESEGSQGEGSHIDRAEIEAAERALYDPRSYLAQSVPKRMAIISAGVIMNLIFAFLMAAVAFGMGVNRVECVAGRLVPGGPAWREGIMVGDRVVEVKGRTIEKFHDMQAAVTLGDDLKEGIPVVVQRPGAAKLLTFNPVPDADGSKLVPRIGIYSSWTNTLPGKRPLAYPGSPAWDCQPGFEPGDVIVAVDGRPVSSYRDLHAELARSPDKTLTITAERKSAGGQEGTASAGPPSRTEITLAPHPMRRLGLVMKMGKITAVQKGSPAESVGIRPGDFITQIDGEPPGDPMTLADRLRRRADRQVVLTVTREAEKEPIKLYPTLRPADWHETPMEEGSPTTVPTLGIAYRVLNRVHSTIDGSPAAEAGLRSDDEILSARLVPPEEQSPEEESLEQESIEIEFGEEDRNWPFFVYALQIVLPQTQVELKWERKGEKMTATVPLADSPDWFNPDRGLLLRQLTFPQKAGSFGEAIKLGAEETIHSTLLVYRFLRKLGEQQVSPRALGGPVSIFVVAKHHAEQGTAELLIFLTLLSANLAVINFLPIPLLDGGHMVLLAWEGIRGKPANERIQLVLTYIGLIFILALMAWVLGLDFGLISRQ